MKKLVTVFLFTFLSILLVACGGNDTVENERKILEERRAEREQNTVTPNTDTTEVSQNTKKSESNHEEPDNSEAEQSDFFKITKEIEEDLNGDSSNNELTEEDIESILQEAGRPMNASISQGVEGNFITLEGRAKDGLSDSHIGRRVKEGMARILIAFQENDVDFEEVRISFYLPTVDAHGKEGQSNMALGVFDKETVDKLEPENEFYISESIESIAMQFELDSQFIE